MFESQTGSSTPSNDLKAAPAASAIPDASAAAWAADLEVVVCPRCHWRFLTPRSTPLPACPHCYQATLSALSEGLPDLPGVYQPELIVPYNLSEPELAEKVHDFAADIPFAPGDLNETALRSRLVPVYLPVWLVDGTIAADWQAEAGFNYEVVSHEERYNGDLHHWQSREIKEPRTRWEIRVGQLNRSYQNVTAPAMDDARQIEETLGRFDLTTARSFNHDSLSNHGRRICICLPDHPPEEAWSETAAAFQKAAAVEVQQACSADRLRQFHWKAQYSRLNWTLMLLPTYSASYTDDDGSLQPVYIHGQTGKLYGSRRASMRRARQSSLYLFLSGILLLLLGFLLKILSDPASISIVISTYVRIIGIAGIVASVAPLLIAWDFNHRQASEPASG